MKLINSISSDAEHLKRNPKKKQQQMNTRNENEKFPYVQNLLQDSHFPSFAKLNKAIKHIKKLLQKYRASPNIIYLNLGVDKLFL